MTNIWVNLSKNLKRYLKALKLYYYTVLKDVPRPLLIDIWLLLPTKRIPHFCMNGHVRLWANNSKKCI